MSRVLSCHQAKQQQQQTTTIVSINHRSRQTLFAPRGTSNINIDRWLILTLPSVARLGPRFLGPDTVLELNTFFTTLHGLIPRITIEHLQSSRLHRALILISGRGTRWPSKLIVLCDLLIDELTVRFGKLDMIRSTLYEKCGRLEGFQDEKQLGRHVRNLLLVYWRAIWTDSTIIGPDHEVAQ